jgi:uncharacterized protein
LVTVSNDAWVSCVTGKIEAIDFALREQLQDAQILVPDDADELTQVLQQNDEYAERDPQINLVVTASSNCALGCNRQEYGGYCGQIHKPGAIRLDAITRVADLLQRSRREYHRSLSISWFGGEPLLALKEIGEATQHLRRVAAELGLDYSATVVTGGTMLTADVARHCFHDLSIRSASISLDGVGPVHDRRRGTKSGKPTFGQIVANVDAIILSEDLEGLALSVRCNVDARNKDDCFELIDFARSKGWQRRVDLYFAPVHPWGQAATGSIRLRPEEFARIESSLLKKLHEEGFPQRFIPPRKKIVCRVVSSSQLVVGTNGDIHRCTETPLTPVNLRRDSLGAPSQFQSISDVPRWEWNSKIADGKTPCSTCNVLPVCGGGCPLSWNTGSDVPCPTVKFNAADRVRLHEGFTIHALERPVPEVSKDGASDLSPLSLLRRVGGEKAIRWTDLHEQEIQRAREIDEKDELLLLAQRTLAASAGFVGVAERKLESALRLGLASYCYFKSGCLDEVISCVDQQVRVLWMASEAAPMDVRAAQLQCLSNLLAAEMRLQSAMDVDLCLAIRRYFEEFVPLRIGAATIRRLDSSTRELSPYLELRNSFSQLFAAGGVSACIR